MISVYVLASSDRNFKKKRKKRSEKSRYYGLFKSSCSVLEEMDK